MGYKYKIKELEVGDISTNDGTQSTVSDINPETGTVSWDIDYVPAFDTTFKEFQELRQYLNKLSKKTDDVVIDQLSDEVSKLFNRYRTHIRKNYSDEYKKTGMNEDEVDEISMSGGAGAYLTPYAFRLPKKKKKKKIKEANSEEESNKVPEAAMILPRGKKVILQAEEQDYKRGLVVELTNEGGYKINYWYGDDVKIYPAEVEVDGVSIKDDANEVYIKFHPELNENKISNPGATLGPGPAASEDGVKDNAYVKQFKYQLVPKDKQGNYVQKGSGLEVKNLF